MDEELNANEAIQIFNLNVFKQKHPQEDWIKLSSRVVQYAKGNLLALNVLGSLLLNLEPMEGEGM